MIITNDSMIGKSLKSYHGGHFGNNFVNIYK